MPYYGERRQPGVNIRMVSTNAPETVDGLTQGGQGHSLCRGLAASTRRSRLSTDRHFWHQFGRHHSALAAEAEPRFARCCPVLAGGDLGLILADSQEKHIVEAKRRWTADGHSLSELLDLMKTIDPVNYGAALQGRQVLMLNASHDEVIPQVHRKFVGGDRPSADLLVRRRSFLRDALYQRRAGQSDGLHGRRKCSRKGRRQTAEGRMNHVDAGSASCLDYCHCPSVTCLVSSSSPRRICSFTRSPPYFSATRSVNSLKLWIGFPSKLTISSSCRISAASAAEWG